MIGQSFISDQQSMESSDRRRRDDWEEKDPYDSDGEFDGLDGEEEEEEEEEEEDDEFDYDDDDDDDDEEEEEEDDD